MRLNGPRELRIRLGGVARGIMRREFGAMRGGCSEGIGEEPGGAGTVAGRRSGAGGRHQRREDPGAEDGDLRDGSAYLRVGRVGERERTGGADDRTRVCGRDRGGRRECVGLCAGAGGQRRGPRGVRALPELPGWAAASVRAYRGRGREPQRGICRVHCAADDEHLAARAVGGPGCGGDLRSAGKCGAYGAGVSVRGRGRAGDGRGADRDYGGRGGAAGGRAAGGDLRPECLPAWRWRRRWA